MPITYLDEVQAAAGEVLVAVPADALGNPTPCEEWDLAALIDHLVDAQWMFVGFATGESPRERDARPSSGDFVAAYDAGAAAIRDLVGVEGFEQQTLQLPFGPFTGAQLIDFVCLETLTHAWDVAMATSQSTASHPSPRATSSRSRHR